ncbi:hypothetical protein MYSTI_07811 [Myxococcus stipitatus DSM 14675]|uniref:Uncharacterized protein n=1 Tax=Myxococcus stipitatus (strain DSM 14675 / JCM 12634 / Mx s8) TaxID=1278073 RepID=L7UM34_MYXSD|nr:hypothetical protein [Myxococcus stipitatus]AGC49083.1 hypothetical protein MYSTI_07811 [Myxococcus stipitatus DSM 14675]
MSPSSADGCEVSSGFLFAHACGLPTSSLCPRCGRRVCAVHMTTLDGAEVCSTCGGLGAGDSEDEGDEDASTYYQDYGYYGSGSSWGRGTSRDPHDFTEADGESLRREEDAAFEEDLGGS